MSGTRGGAVVKKYFDQKRPLLVAFSSLLVGDTYNDTRFGSASFARASCGAEMPPKRKGKKKKRRNPSTASDGASGVGVGTTTAHHAAACFADLNLDHDPYAAAESHLRAFIASVPGLIERMDALAWTGRDASSVLVLETEPDGSDSFNPALNSVPRSAWSLSGQYFFSIPGRRESTGYPLRAMFQRLNRDAEYILIAELRHLRHLPDVSPTRDPFFRSCAVLAYV